MEYNYKKIIFTFTVLIICCLLIIHSINLFNEIKNQKIIHNKYKIFIVLILVLDYFLFFYLLKSVILDDNLIYYLSIAYCPLLFLLLIPFFYYKIKYPIREFRTAFESVKYLLGLIIIMIVFLNYLFRYSCSKKII